MLHAAEIWFTHPATGEAIHLVSPLPSSFHEHSDCR
jgi:23S rRNA-/tRNA-specific pseudouridylate synthase